MKVLFDKSFIKSLDKLADKSLKIRLIDIIGETEKANSISEIPQIKKLSGFKEFYRIRIGSYRLGLELTNKDTVLFIIIAHRKDIYKIFP